MAHKSYDQLKGMIWYNNEWVQWQDAKVHFLTHGLHYGSCVFEGLRAYNGRIFKLEEHTERLFESANILGFDLPYSKDLLNEAQKQILKKMNLNDAYIRPAAWRGSEMMGVSAQRNTINVAIAAWEWPSYFDPEQKMKGIKLDIAKYQRPDPKTAPFKSKAAGLYMICTLSKHEAENKGFDDALMYDYQGNIAEATGANIFFIQDGKIHTPKPDCFLDGITRRTVIDLAKKRNIEIIERKITQQELPSFEQCFVTGTAAEVTPVSKIGPHTYTVGELTTTLMHDYTDEVTRDPAIIVAAE